ncbi:MAG: hypothetical protein GXP45_08375 [bacterium]|nr:hypothetical protein [bacterium]
MKKGNFLGNVKDNNPIIIGWDNQDFKNKNKIQSSDSLLFVNHAFNPLFVNIKKTYNNLELVFRIDDTGFLPIIIKEL